MRNVINRCFHFPVESGIYFVPMIFNVVKYTFNFLNGHLKSLARKLRERILITLRVKTQNPIFR